MCWSKTMMMMLFCFSIAGCGWQPLYGGLDELQFLETGITIAPSKKPIEQQVRKKLQRFFNHGDQYHLKINVKLTTLNFLIQRDGDVSRQRLAATAFLKFYDQTQTKLLLKDQVSVIVSYNRDADNLFSRLTTERDAQKRVIDQLVYTIQRRLVVFLKGRNENQAS